MDKLMLTMVAGITGVALGAKVIQSENRQKEMSLTLEQILELNRAYYHEYTMKLDQILSILSENPDNNSEELNKLLISIQQDVKAIKMDLDTVSSGNIDESIRKMMTLIQSIEQRL